MKLLEAKPIKNASTSAPMEKTPLKAMPRRLNQWISKLVIFRHKFG